MVCIVDLALTWYQEKLLYMMNELQTTGFWVTAFCLLLTGVVAGDESATEALPAPFAFERADEAGAVEKATSETNPAMGAMQTIYREGVPHTDRRGLQLMKYDPERSFFPIGIMNAPTPEAYGHNHDWQLVADAGFNTIWPWPLMAAADSLEVGKKTGLQILLMNPWEADTLEQIKDHPNLLGNMWYDEPIGQLESGRIDQMFQDFTAYKKMAEQIAPDMLVFVVDAPWITPPATEWWIRWNTSGDVSCHDNYPIWPVTRSLTFGTRGTIPNSIPQSMTLAVKENKQRKPIWLIVGAFEIAGSPKDAYPFRYPTPTQMRTLVYTGIIYGATGIHYFIWDSWIGRQGHVLGISHDPKVAYVPNPKKEGSPDPCPATPTQLVQSRALWDTAVQINKELKELTPVIFAPTAGEELAYSVTPEGETITPSPIRALLKPHPDGGYVLFTVNLDNAIVVATYDFNRALRSVAALFENREDPAVACEGKRFVEDYEPFETHIYRIAFNSS
jgi:hypothetical protein